jgi:Coagulation Factor Xa inhibitory site
MTGDDAMVSCKLHALQVLIFASLDINECDGDHGCEQICTNLPGSFECACHPGLQLDLTNNKQCIGERASRDFCLINASPLFC